MRPMAPAGSHHRAQGRREPTDAQKTARIAMIRSRQRMAKGLGNVEYPTASFIEGDDDPSDDVAFYGERETWARPEPNPQYQINFNANMRKLEAAVLAEAEAEDRLKSLNHNISSMEATGTTYNAASKDVEEGIDAYNNLKKQRQIIQNTSKTIASGTQIDRRGGLVPAGLGGGAGVLLTLGVLYYWRKRSRATSTTRYTGTTDRLAIFGNY
jgi:hypothetical protein